MKKLIQLVELWDVDVSKECCSPKVEIIFSALKSTICEIGERASQLQGRSITRHVIAIWQDLLNSMMIENEWDGEKLVLTMDEYMSNAHVVGKQSSHTRKEISQAIQGKSVIQSKSRQYQLILVSI